MDGDGAILSDIYSSKIIEVRLLGIDAPELKRCRKLYQDEKETHLAGDFLIHLGRLSLKQLCKYLIIGDKVSFTSDKSDYLDPYGRSLGYLFNSKGECINDLMVSDGYAKVFTKYYCERQDILLKLETAARRQGKGLHQFGVKF